jgi:hypothetical protein
MNGRLWASAVALLFAAPAGTAAQTSAPPAVLAGLEGEWVGSGVLLGRSGTFRMEWRALEPGFVHLSFSNAWVDGQDTIPVLTSEATYLVRDRGALGVWIDTRPQQLTLSATLSDTSVVTEWTAPAERGRTEYFVRSPQEVVVRDFVYANGSEQLFGEATYRRRSGAPSR